MKNLDLGYTISPDLNLLSEQHAITPELANEIDMYYQLAREGKRSSIKKLLDAIKKYPKNPQLKNYLTNLYHQLGETKKVSETTKWIVKEHPDYLYGKVNLAFEYHANKAYHKMPEVLGSDMDLKALYPNRDTFQVNEVLLFLRCVVYYYTAIDRIEEAEQHYKTMTAIDPDALDTEEAHNNLFFHKAMANLKRFKERNKNKISIETKPQKETTSTKIPTFNHQEIEWLYCNGLYIGKEKLNTILSLPRPTLIQDLELILQDSIDRFSYFENMVKEHEWDEEKMSFMVHAIFILGELKATESREAFFHLLSQSEALMEFYFGDFITLVWEPLYKIASNNLEACKQFVYLPGIDCSTRTNFTEMVSQIALHQPDRREEILKWFTDIIDFFLNSSLDDNVIDSDFIGLFISDIFDFKGTELRPKLEKLFEQQLVSIGICGDWEDVKNELDKSSSERNGKRDILSIAERYEHITSTWAGYNEENDHDFTFDSNEESDSDFMLDNYNVNKTPEAPILPVKAEPKIGRNKPCPCGSGKKYKKCCLNN